MVRLAHPTIAGVHVDVRDGEVDRWAAQGWIAPTQNKPEPAAAPRAPRRKRK